MRNKIDLYSRIAIALVVAILGSEFLVRNVFLSYTPRVRPDLADLLVNKTLALVNIDTYRNMFKKDKSSDIAFITNTPKPISNVEKARAELINIPLQPTFIKGVYAKESDNARLTEIRIDEVDWIVVPYQNKKGATIQLRIPRGTEPPPPGLF